MRCHAQCLKRLASCITDVHHSTIGKEMRRFSIGASSALKINRLVGSPKPLCISNVNHSFALSQA